MAAVLSTLVVVVPSAPVAAADPPVCDGEEATLYVDENGDVAGSRGTATKSGNRWTFTGTSGIDVIVGTNGPDTIKGLQGNDRICSMDGSDYVSAGPGNDRVFALGGNDTVLGGNNDDYLHGGGGDDTLKGGRGNDDLRGRIGNDTLIGGNGNDRMDGHTGADSFSPGAGTDTCLDPDSTTDFGGCENRPTFALPAPNLTSLHLTPEGRVNARWAPVANAGGYQVEWFYDVAQSADRVFLGRTSVFSGATTTDQLWPSDDRVVCARVVAVPGAEDYRASTPGNERCLGAQVEACLQVTPSTDMGQAVYAAVTQSSVLANSSVSARAMASGCNTVHDVWVNEPGVSRLYHGVHHLLSTAEHDVRMVFFDVQVESQAMTSIGLGLMDAVEALPAGRVLEVEVVIGAPLLWRNLNMFDNPAWEQFENNPKIRVVVREQNDLAAKSGTNVLHDKLIVVDGTSIVVAGANPQTSNDYPNHWFDFGVRIDGPVAVGANENFQDAWSAATDDALRNRPYTFSTIPTNGTERMVLLPRVDGIGVHGLDDTTNPQDVGFLTVFGEAKRNSTIRVMSPNIGDNNFLAAVNRALDNDVNVQILTSLDFNSFKAGLPTQGAPNCRVVRDLLEDHDDRLVNGVERFGMGKLEIRWHGLDGQAIEGKTAGAGHAKYLQYLVNDNLGLIPEVTIVGSGNQDTQAWDQSHEFNVLIEGDRAGLDQQVWRPAWGRAVEAAPFECV